MRYFLLLLLTCTTFLSAKAAEPKVEAKALLTMLEEDQAVRMEILDFFKEYGMGRELDPAIIEKQHTVASEHTDKLKQMVAQEGWPKLSVVGQEAATAAFIITQNATDPQFQKEALELMEQLLPDGEVMAPHVATLTDRVLILEGKPQKFGTRLQPKIVAGELSLEPVTEIEDLEGLDERREKMGLPPYDEYMNTMRKIHGI